MLNSCVWQAWKRADTIGLKRYFSTKGSVYIWQIISSPSINKSATNASFKSHYLHKFIAFLYNTFAQNAFVMFKRNPMVLPPSHSLKAVSLFFWLAIHKNVFLLTHIACQKLCSLKNSFLPPRIKETLEEKLKFFFPPRRESGLKTRFLQTWI